MGVAANPLDWRRFGLDANMNSTDADIGARHQDDPGMEMPGTRPRVLMTASTAPRWPGDVEPEFVLQLAQALAPAFDITVLAPHCPGSARAEDLDGVHVHRFRYAPQAWENLAYGGGMLHKLREQRLRWLLVPGFILGQMFAMWRLHRQQRFDLLHVHWIVPQGLAAALLKRLRILSIPSLLTSHGGDLFSLDGVSAIKRKILASMDRVSVVSRAMVPVCEALGLPPEKVFVRSMGVDLRRRFSSSQPLDQRRGLVFVGRLVEKKGVDVLLRAFATVHREFPAERLTVVGDGPLRPSLEALAQEFGCESAVEFVGAVPNQQVPGYLNEASIAVVPSVVASDGDQEGLGLVAVEAMGCGCAVVCSDLPALRDVITDGENGRTFPAGDYSALATILGTLLREPAGTRKLAVSGHGFVMDRFDWEAVAQEYGQCYRQLLQSRDSAD
jgi:glycosyltransferase involved in cell wall biosynthesis